MFSLLYPEEGVKRLYVEKNDDMEELYRLLREANKNLEFILEGLDCYKEHKCGWWCRKVDDSEMKECDYIYKVSLEIYGVEFSNVDFVDYKNLGEFCPIFRFYTVKEA